MQKRRPAAVLSAGCRSPLPRCSSVFACGGGRRYGWVGGWMKNCLNVSQQRQISWSRVSLPVKTSPLLPKMIPLVKISPPVKIIPLSRDMIYICCLPCEVCEACRVYRWPVVVRRTCYFITEGRGGHLCPFGSREHGATGERWVGGWGGGEWAWRLPWE